MINSESSHNVEWLMFNLSKSRTNMIEVRFDLVGIREKFYIDSAVHSNTGSSLSFTDASSCSRWG